MNAALQINEETTVHDQATALVAAVADALPSASGKVACGLVFNLDCFAGYCVDISPCRGALVDLAFRAYATPANRSRQWANLDMAGRIAWKALYELDGVELVESLRDRLASPTSPAQQRVLNEVNAIVDLSGHRAAHLLLLRVEETAKLLAVR